MIKVVRKSLCPVYELEDLRGQQTDGQLNTEKATPVRTKQTT